VISSSSGKWRTWRSGEIDHFIRPDLSVFIGFSGGALIDPAGCVIGINCPSALLGARRN
jgi:serine protease DegQ